MRDKLDFDVLVSPEEAVKISAYHRGINDLSVAMSIAEAYNKMSLFSKSEPLFYTGGMLAAVWNGGRIQWIREERAKRKSL